MAKGSRKRNRNKRQGEKGTVKNDNNNARKVSPSATAAPAAAPTAVFPVVVSNADSLVPAHSFPLVTRVVRSTALGATLPPLVITYTNEQSSIVKWLQKHVHGGGSDRTNNKQEQSCQCLGLDTESKPCFTREAAKSARGPDTLQLAVADGHCLVIHLSRMETIRDLNRMFHNIFEQEQPNHHSVIKPRCQGFSSLLDVLKNKKIAKAGVGVDDDALELHKNHLIDISCRLDLRNIDKNEEDEEEEDQKMPLTRKDRSGNGAGEQEKPKKKQAPNGLKVLAEKYVNGLILPKKKRLQMSNWAASLSGDQVSYAAADAFAGVAVVAALTNATDSVHTYQSMIEEALADELDIHLLEEDRARRKRERQKKKDKERRDKKPGVAKRKSKHKHQHKPNQNNNKRKGIPEQEHLHQNKKRKSNSEQNESPFAPVYNQRSRNKKRKISVEQGETPFAPVYGQLSTALRSSR